ncbi:hypothetical protein [Methylocella tundrae]|uniref:hypothetical protein n=1 Tax=Methylocella tundrae TaxID=227605 RepID=UPI00157B931A|nr:hypothetical protein [Methylocella tundrae]
MIEIPRWRRRRENTGSFRWSFRQAIERSENRPIELLNCLAGARRVTITGQEGQIVEKDAGAIGVDALRFRPKAAKLSENDSAVSKFIRPPQCRAVRDARAVSPSTSPFREARPT